VNPKSTSNQSSKPCTVLQYPSNYTCAWVMHTCAWVSNAQSVVGAVFVSWKIPKYINDARTHTRRTPRVNESRPPHGNEWVTWMSHDLHMGRWMSHELLMWMSHDLHMGTNVPLSKTQGTRDTTHPCVTWYIRVWHQLHVWHDSCIRDMTHVWHERIPVWHELIHAWHEVTRSILEFTTFDWER